MELVLVRSWILGLDDPPAMDYQGHRLRMSEVIRRAHAG